MPIINQNNTCKHRLIKLLIQNIQSFLDSDHKLVIFFDAYFDGLLLQNIILDYTCYIKTNEIDIDVVLSSTGKRLIIKINRKNASYKLSKK